MTFSRLPSGFGSGDRFVRDRETQARRGLRSRRYVACRQYQGSARRTAQRRAAALLFTGGGMVGPALSGVLAYAAGFDAAFLTLALGALMASVSRHDAASAAN